MVSFPLQVSTKAGPPTGAKSGPFWKPGWSLSGPGLAKGASTSRRYFNEAENRASAVAADLEQLDALRRYHTQARAPARELLTIDDYVKKLTGDRRTPQVRTTASDDR